jgi:hypothetical protein
MQKIILFFLIATLLSCGHKNKIPTDSFCLEGKISTAEGKIILIKKLGYNEVSSIDSVMLNASGNFSFILKPEGKEIYMLMKDPNHFITIIAEKSEDIVLETNYNEFDKNYSIKGSPESELLLKLNIHLQQNLHKMDSLGKIWEVAVNKADRVETKKKLDSCYFKILADQREFQLNFVKNNTSSLAALIALYQPLNREPVLKEETDFPVFEKLSIDLLKALPNNTHAINFEKRIKQHKMLMLEQQLTEEAKTKNIKK